MFHNNIANENGGGVALLILNYPVKFINCTFQFNMAYRYGGGVYLGEGNGFGLLKKVTSNAIEFYECLMHSNQALIDGGAVYAADLNAFQFLTMILRNNTAEVNGGALGLDSKNSIDFIDTKILMNIAGHGGGAISSTTSNVVTTYGIFEINGNIAYIEGGGIYARSLSTFDFENNTKFENNSCYALQCVGGALSVRDNSIIRIEGITYFNGNKAIGTGGAVSLVDSFLSFGVQSIYFENNTAAYGSAMNLGRSSTSKIDISSNSSSNQLIIFRNNVCLKNGGTVYWIKDKVTTIEVVKQSLFFLTPSITNITRMKWIDNQAIYGNKTATQPYKLLQQYSTIIVTEYFQDIYPPPVMNILNFYGELDVLDFATAVTSSVDESNCKGYFAYLSGTTTVFANRGIASFTNMSAFCYPGGNMTIKFTAFPKGLGSPYGVEGYVKLHYRECQDGEVLVYNQCYRCNSGTYSFHYSPIAECIPCPPHTTDCYGNTLVLQPGYWRLSPYTTTMLECPYGSKSCPGGLFPTITNQSDIENIGCAIGFKGVLCSRCAQGYFYSSTANTCEFCGKKTATQLALLIFLPLLFLFFIALSIFSFSKIIIWMGCINRNLTTEKSIKIITSNKTNDINRSVKKYSRIAQKRILNQFLIMSELTKTKEFRSLIPKFKIILAVFQIISGFPFSLDLRFPSVSTYLLRIARYVRFVNFFNN